jgi:diadenosine tetraphosphatase ApaH/serine/threonine PP2A family protein phosphatase
MRKIALSLAGAAAALGLAAPASAQFYPYYSPVYAPRVYGYGYATPAIAHSMEARLAGIRAQVRDLSFRGRISYGQARSLERQAFDLQRQVHFVAWNGLSPGERYSLDIRIANLERRVQIAATRVRHYGPRYRYAGYRWF